MGLLMIVKGLSKSYNGFINFVNNDTLLDAEPYI